VSPAAVCVDFACGRGKCRQPAVSQVEHKNTPKALRRTQLPVPRDDGAANLRDDSSAVTRLMKLDTN
jgi:hypothetical protein